MKLEEIKKILENKLNRIEKCETQFHIGQKQQISDVLLMLSKLHQPDVSGRSEQLFCVCKNRKDQFKRNDIWICGDCEEEIKQNNCH